MWSTVRNFFSLPHKKKLASLENLASKEGSFEKQYISGISIESRFDAIPFPKGHNERFLQEPPQVKEIKERHFTLQFKYYGEAHLFPESLDIRSIDYCLEHPKILLAVEVLEQPAIFDPLNFSASATKNISELLPLFCSAVIADVTNSLVQHPITEQFNQLILPGCIDVTDSILQQALDSVVIAEPFRCLSSASIVDIKELLYPDIYIRKITEYFTPLKSKIDGKTYGANVERTSQQERETNEKSRFFPSERKTLKQIKKKELKSSFNVFDLIFPVLQRPLGSDFDDTLSFPNPLYPYQVLGTKFLVDHYYALLGDEMGLGKTVQVITACRVLFRRGEITSAFVLCPKAVLTNWERELWKWAPELRTIKIAGNQSDRELQWKQDAHVYICTYESARNDFDTITKHRRRKRNQTGVLHFDVLVLDEIQKTKNPKAGLTKAVRSIETHYRWGMSGTPLENSIDDLITICETLDTSVFKSIRESDWTVPSVKRAYQPMFLRRRAKDVLQDLPDKISQSIWLELSSKQQKIYDVVESRGVNELKGLGDSATVQHVIALITKLKLICNYESESNESVKLDYLKDELEELAAGEHKALIFSQYPNETLRKILPALNAYNPKIYDGTLSDKARNKIVDEFQNTKESRFLLLSLKAANAGINLHRANYVYHFDMWWNPAVTNQATGRALRIGNKAKKVFEYFLLTKGTIEERIFAKVKEKEQLFRLVVDDLSEENDLAATHTMTNDEIFGLFGLKDPKRKMNTLDSGSTRSNTFSKDMNLLDPFQFEDLVAYVFDKMGYHTKVTQKSRDGGVDIYVKYPDVDHKEAEAIIQCKHKEDTNASVGVEVVRELYGVLKSKEHFSKAIIVTNAGYSSDANDFAQANGIELLDGYRLKQLMEKYT